MQIILMETTNLIPFIIPHVPTSTRIELNNNNINPEVNTINGRIKIFGNRALRKLKWTSFFPVKNTSNFRPYTAHLNGYAYVVFIEAMRRLEMPIRVIGLSNQGIPIFNFLACVEEFSWGLDRQDNINYSIELGETPERIRDTVRRYTEIADTLSNEQSRADLLERLGLAVRNL